MTYTTPEVNGITTTTGAHRDPSSDGPQAKAQAAAEQAQEKAQQAAGEVQARLREQIAQRSSQAAEQIRTQTADLRAVSDSLREQGKDGPANVADRLANYAQRVGDYLHEKDADTLLSDAEDFGRRKPWAATVGGLGLGFAASRFLKASSRQRYATATQQRYPSPPQRYPGAAQQPAWSPPAPSGPPPVHSDLDPSAVHAQSGTGEVGI